MYGTANDVIPSTKNALPAPNNPKNKTGFRPSITISLENQNPIEIRNILLQYLLEDIDKENESFSDGLSRLMRLYKKINA